MHIQCLSLIIKYFAICGGTKFTRIIKAYSHTLCCSVYTARASPQHTLVWCSQWCTYEPFFEEHMQKMNTRFCFLANSFWQRIFLAARKQASVAENWIALPLLTMRFGIATVQNPRHESAILNPSCQAASNIHNISKRWCRERYIPGVQTICLLRKRF